jgi:hypothetical protein
MHPGSGAIRGDGGICRAVGPFPQVLAFGDIAGLSRGL